MDISKEDWLDWKSQRVTRAFFQAIQERIADTKDVLAVSAGLDEKADNFFRGFIAGQVEVSEFKIEFEGESE